MTPNKPASASSPPSPETASSALKTACPGGCRKTLPLQGAHLQPPHPHGPQDLRIARPPAAGRTNIVITRNPVYCKDGCLVAASIPAALALCQDVDEVFFIGGADLYAQAIRSPIGCI